MSVTPSGQTPAKKRYFVQAPIEPLPVDGVNAFVIGTVAAALLCLLAWARLSALTAAGHRWLMWAGLASLLIGFVGLGYCLWRRESRKKLARSGITPPTP